MIIFNLRSLSVIISAKLRSLPTNNLSCDLWRSRSNYLCITFTLSNLKSLNSYQ
ncbi:hypothetical protein ACN23B_20785 [Anabaena sp. FACHB-709]|uniref:Uncharacterized protein n=1 Tax=Anabaena cylindrica FACHB-318 TaxID=2692880 RepID=A0ABR7ZJN7_ANACY|nr:MULTISPECIES: hypothetical protein [Nostocaceae]MBD2172871.1 hypothetical protein [Anabaena cylindrica FACHB-318]MBD2264504.1 hypothetical protein [Anabaena sp. FACHB-709]MBD2273800.1 hypothetical protein [Nostoc sp. PCC 7120 = FACHB-418]MBD2284918.1 hypothetical protein [Anabaena cylindrica FACHB-170]MBD2349712.1 hypothetical protein [Trichormus variabilis FACHB-171]